MGLESIVLIGSSGFLGSNIVNYNQQYKLFNLIPVTRYNSFYWKTHIEQLNIEPIYTIWCAGISSKIYCNENPGYCWEQNVDNLLEAINSFPGKKFIYISSLDVYPENWYWKEKTENKFIDSDIISNYGKTKLQGEELVKQYCDNYLIVRCNGFSGVGLKKNVIYDINQPDRKIWVGINSLFQFIHVDVFITILLYLANNINNEIINLSSLQYISVLDIVNYLNIPIEEINYPPSSDRIALFNTTKLNSLIKEEQKKHLSKDVAIHYWNKNYYEMG